MALLIDNDVTRRVLETADAVEVLEDAFTQLAKDEAGFQPRTDLVSPITGSGDDYDWDGEPECYTGGSMLGPSATRPGSRSGSSRTYSPGRP